ncbi:hypothetical protein ETB97_005194 [Aspergillus alliaceus]|uniref:Uncharacterized protein n=1 Tax=Petromyces alliaceus TaxID=209559 RepID=A0A8H6E4A8_PETAA|nr:hypothetical protein ETB97_005194 [Aspergillus burnettii]
MVITDAQATTQTNPLVCAGRPSSLADSPTLRYVGFLAKLEAVDHYARVLALEYAFSRWPGDASRHGMSPAQKGQVVEALDEVPLDWLDRDEKRPPVDILRSFRKPRLLHGEHSNMVKLRHGESACVIHVKRYQVKAEMYENYTVESLVAECYPALVATKTTIKKANQAACEYLQEELGPKHLAQKWDEIYKTGGRIRI